MEKIGVGIIGCGAISSVHLEAIKKDKRVALIGLCDQKPDRVREKGAIYGGHMTSDYLELLQNKQIQVVHILTPHYLHVPMTLEAVKYGKHVVLEKPVGIHFEELEQLKKLADAQELVIGVVLQNRFNPTTEAFKREIDQQKLGKLLASKAILAWNRDDDYYSQSDWRGQLSREGGGLLINQAIHTLDLMAYLGGEIISLEGMITNQGHPGIQVEDTAAITMDYQNGAKGIFFGSNNYPVNQPIQMEFLFENGELRLEDHGAYLLQEKEMTLLARDDIQEGLKSYWGQSHERCIRNIYDAILKRKALRVTLEDGVKATELVLGAYKSCKTGKRYLPGN